MFKALYRKWRPQVFADVVGQEHITVTLKNEVREKKVNHAYVFTGTRGTGKTTCAKILAKAVNCLDLKNGDPCNKCDVCVGINDGSILDIIEIDAASNNSVDDIRLLRDEVVYAPSRVAKKVYIIDEVHMLSTAAFNALLKTLEEPPSHILFILATTEIHKIPQTILSRCQRFDFRRINAMQIFERLEYVCKEEKIPYERQALITVSKIADGSMRDALSLLDKCSGSGCNIDDNEVLNCTGTSSKEHIYGIIENVAEKNIGNCFEIIANLYFNSKDMTRLCEDLINAFRNLLIVKTVDEPINLLEISQAELEQLKTLSSKYRLERVLYAINIVQQAVNKMYHSPNKRVEVEMAVVRLCDERLSDGNDAVLSRIAELEAKLLSGQFSSNITSEPQKSVTKKEKAIAEIKQETEEKQEKSEKSKSMDKPSAAFWKDVLATLQVTNKMGWSLLKDSKVMLSNDELIISTENAITQNFLKDEDNKSNIAGIVKNLTSKDYKIKVSAEKQADEGDSFSELLSENSDDIQLF